MGNKEEMTKVTISLKIERILIDYKIDICTYVYFLFEIRQVSKI